MNIRACMYGWTNIDGKCLQVFAVYLNTRCIERTLTGTIYKNERAAAKDVSRLNDCGSVITKTMSIPYNGR